MKVQGCKIASRRSFLTKVKHMNLDARNEEIETESRRCDAVKTMFRALIRPLEADCSIFLQSKHPHPVRQRAQNILHCVIEPPHPALFAFYVLAKCTERPKLCATAIPPRRTPVYLVCVCCTPEMLIQGG